MKRRMMLCMALLLPVACMPAGSGKFDVNELYRQVLELVQRYYPDATSHVIDNRIYFESRSRMYVIHEPLKTGEWQDPREVRGPKKEGVVGEIHLEEGRYQGAAALPASFDKRYFTEWISVHYSEKLNAHLHVSIKCPAQFPEAFYSDLMKVLTTFDRYVSGSEG